MKTADVVVVGGGLSGLAAALTAERRGASVVVLEAQDEPGGLARSFRRDGYTFDCSGHLLHVSRAETRSLIESVTSPHDWTLIARHSAVVFGATLVPYPFQLHLAHVPSHERKECIESLPEDEPELPEDPSDMLLDEWIAASLGEGIGRHFMVPYNEKVATVPVSELTCHWLGRFMPRPSLEAIREGAARRRIVATTGYNASFLYPAAGGIDLLWRSLATPLADVRTSAPVAEIDTARRLVRTTNGERFRYREGIVCSAPLAEMSKLVRPTSATLKLGARLKSNEVTCVNLGLRRVAPRFEGVHWLYLPEARFRAYRVGFYTSFVQTMAPRDRTGVYLDIAHRGPVDPKQLIAAAIADLVELEAISSADDVEVAEAIRIPQAYVLQDHDYAWARSRILDELTERRVLMVGRYGRWEYAAMEDALLQGIEAAHELTPALDAPVADVQT